MKHIDQIDTIHHFAPSQTKHLLPYHKPHIITNLFTITQTYIGNKYPKKLLFAPDQSLTSQKHPHYDKIQIYWSDDIDNNQEHLRKSISLGTKIINYYHTLDTNYSNQQCLQTSQDIMNNIINTQQLLSITDTIKIQKSLYRTHHQNQKLCCYNFIKYQQKILILFGFISQSKNNLCTFLGGLRQSNLSRLGVPLSEYSFDRIDRIIQHIFIAGRPFLRQVPDDYNTYKKNVFNFLQQQQSKSLTNDQYHKLCQKHKLSQNNLRYNLKLYKIKIMYRNIQQKLVWKMICEISTQMLLNAPKNCSCSFGVFKRHQQKQNTVYISFALHYIQNSQKLIEHIDITRANKQICKFLASKCFIHNKNNKKTDQMLKQSLVFLQKFENKGSFMSKSDNESNKGYSQNFMNSSFISNTSNASKISKINMKKIAKLQNQIYQILKLLQNNQPILTPQQIQTKIVQHCKWLQNRYNKCKGYPLQMTQDKYLMFQSLKNLLDELTPQDINLLLKSNIGQQAPILSTFMQHFNYDKTVTLGKILALQNLQQLFRKTLQNGFSTYRHSIIPFFIKQMLQSFSNSHDPDSFLILDEISIPKLIQLLQTKQYDGNLYSSMISLLVPQLFRSYQQKLKIISPLLYLYIEYLLRLNHHQQLVFSFIGQVVFQCLYFQNQAKLNSLTNTMYLQDNRAQISLKQKKIVELIRQGGFKGYGFQIRKYILSDIEAHKSFRISDQSIYSIIDIKYPLMVLKFLKLLHTSNHNQTIIKFGRFYHRKDYFNKIFQKGQPLICFMLHNNDNLFMQKQIQKQQETYNKEYESISRRILSSQSGIFQQMVTLNPKIKIAGIQLASAINNLTDSRKLRQNHAKKRNGCIDKKNAIQSMLKQSSFREYQLIELAQSLKDKYIEYYLLTEQQKSYFRDCASRVVEQKQKIIEYVVISNKIKEMKT